MQTPSSAETDQDATVQDSTTPSALTPDGSPYLIRGAKLLLAPGYKRFILIPILSNIILFALTISLLIGYVSGLMESYLSWLPDWEWLQIVHTFIWLIFGVLVAFLYSLTFTAITNLIAAPFNGFLSEKIQQAKTLKPLPPESIGSIIKRTIAREFQKLLYFAGIGICIYFGLLILGFIPLLNLLAPVIAISWACWVLALQYVDYAADNNQREFKQLRMWCGEKRMPTLVFGATVFVCTLIPIVNILVMSAAVAGGTLYWLEEGGETA